MTKQTVYTEVDRFTWYDWDDKTVADVVLILNTLPQDATFDSRSDYDYEYGVVLSQRLETDEEEAAREAKEAEKEAQRQRKTDIEIARRVATEETLLRSKVAIDVALHSYLQTHKDNPNLNDLENLFRARMQLEFDGHPKDGVAMKAILECMEKLESNN